MTFWRRTPTPCSTSDFPAPRRVVRRGVRLGAVAAAGALALCGVPVAAQAAATTGQTTFAVSGALQGTLSTGNYGCSDIGGYGAQFEFFNTLKGLKATEWVVNVNNLGKQKNGGTFKKFGGLLGNGVSIVLEASTAKTSYWWATKSGTLTITPTSGHLHVLLVPDQSAVGKPGKGNVHLVGSWGCIASS